MLHFFNRSILFFVFSLLGFVTLFAKNKEIVFSEYLGKYSYTNNTLNHSNMLYLVSPSTKTITIRVVDNEKFNGVHIDGTRIGYTSLGIIWDSFTLSLSDYNDGGIHELTIFKGGVSSAICNFIIGDTIIEDGNLSYLIKDDFAYVFSTSKDIKEAKIRTSIQYEDKELTVSRLSTNAFTNCKSLLSVAIPNSIISIGGHAFNNCTSLTELALPNSLIEIEQYAFENCNSMKEIEIPSSITTLRLHTFYKCSSLAKVILPNSLKNIEKSAFEDCTVLDNVIIPNSVVNIGISAFRLCRSLSKIVLSDSLTNISAGMFDYCTSLIDLNLPNSISTIESYAFEHCSGLQSINIPGKVSTIGDDIFYDCNNLKEVYWYTPVTPKREIQAEKVYTFRDSYYGKNAVYLDFLQFNHVSTLKTGVKIDYSERLQNFDIEGYEIESLSVDGVNIPLSDDGKYFVKIQNIPSYKKTYLITMKYFDPRAQRQIQTTLDGLQTDNKLLRFPASESTHSTVSFTFQYLTDESFEIDEVFFRKPNDESYAFTYTGEGKVTFDGLPIGSSFEPICVVKCKDGRSIVAESPKLYTKSIQFTEESVELNPTSIALNWSYDAGDAEDQIDKFNIVINPIYESSVIKNNPSEKRLVNMPLESKITATITATTHDGRSFEEQKEYTLPPLVLNVKEATAISNDCAIICAETNIADEEIGCGFEWRRYDAPDMVPSTFVKCSVSDYIMAGKLKGLSPNTYYKYRPFYEDYNGNRTFGEWIAFGTADAYVYFEPIVRTYQPSDITETSATIVGYALEGSDNIIEQGFEYWISQIQSRSASNIQRVQCSGERMVATISDLIPGYTYSIRAYAKTSKETTYGEEQLFTTITPEEIDEDSINEVTVTSEAFDIYTIAGVCVRRKATSFNGLQPGIYIANGRKYFIR